MIDIQAIQAALVGGLRGHLGRPVVLLDQASPRPDYPFMGYKVTSSLIPERGMPAETGGAVPSQDPEWQSDFQYTQASQPTVVVSLTAYSRDVDEALQLALQAKAWLHFQGYEGLKESGIVVASSGSVQNRDTFMVDDYERRQGFDVTLRVSSALTRTVPTIEHVNISSTVR